ncbi:MAG: N-acetylmuramoyl-L-alanine amidase [Candidatus Kapaibacterium sp.]|nr:MAG: N-acetylmuramoyl-L-alanine amidase [Candidatus Kapabacteria bacterium]
MTTSVAKSSVKSAVKSSVKSTATSAAKSPKRKQIPASKAPRKTNAQEDAQADASVHTDEAEKDVSGDNDFRSAKKKWALDVIVLDAGHGGKDAGTIGVAKTKEKDVALAVVKKLGVLLKKELPGTKVVYTRTDDTFVELDRRGQIANENGGKLFVSIHCNATPKKPSPANGFEIYILRPGRNEDAVRIAEVENSVIKLEDDPKRYKPLTDEQFIVVSMAQSSFVKYSDMAAAMITAEVKKMRELGVRGVNQAGFLVLVGASMPNMLIETGFLSNKKEEKFLKSAAGQNKLALAICRAIKAFRVRYEAQIRGIAPSEIASPSKQTASKEATRKKTSPKAAKPSSAAKQTKKPEHKKTSGSKKKT